MDLKLDETAYERERSFSDAATLAEGTLQLLDDAAGRHCGGDARYHAFRALVTRIQAEIANATDAYEAVATALQEPR